MQCDGKIFQSREGQAMGYLSESHWEAGWSSNSGVQRGMIRRAALRKDGEKEGGSFQDKEL